MSEDTRRVTYEDRERNVQRLIRRYRKKKGWSQAELAAAMRNLGFSWSQYTVTHIEAGERHLSLTETMACADTLEITEGWFWEHKENLGRSLEDAMFAAVQKAHHPGL